MEKPGDAAAMKKKIKARDKRALKNGTLFMFVIYDKPSDYPANFVVRKHFIKSGETGPTAEFWLAANLIEARAKIPKSMVNIGRTPLDYKSIVEVWV